MTGMIAGTIFCLFAISAVLGIILFEVNDSKNVYREAYREESITCSRLTKEVCAYDERVRVLENKLKDIQKSAKAIHTLAEKE